MAVDDSDQQAGVDGGAHLDADRQQDAGRDGGGQRDLRGAADDHQPADPPEPLEAELDPDGEQQQHHPDLGGRLDHVGARHQSERVRTDQHPGDEEPHDRDLAEHGS